MTDALFTDKVTCLINPRAANSKWLRRKKLRAYLEDKLPGEIHDVFGDPTTTIERAKAASRDSRIIVAMGGDGTIADAFQGIFEAGREKDVLFGVIPFGSGNAFRKAFGIPKNPRRAIDRLATGIPRDIDLMNIEGRYAAFASIGATARVTEEKLKHDIQGLWGHFLAGRKLFAESPTEKEIEFLDGRDKEGPFERKVIHSKFFDCIITKTNYFGYGWNIAPEAKVNDGLLDITLFEVGPLKYTIAFPLIYFGLYQKRQRHFKAKRILIEGKDLPVQYNGEFLGQRERVAVSVLPKAIKIICPRTRRSHKRFVVAD